MRFNKPKQCYRAVWTSKLWLVCCSLFAGAEL